MLQKFKKYIKDNNLFNSSNRLLVAVSGGNDSMVLLYLLKKLDFKITVAHCNFNLRPDDCDKDQKLVEDFCIEHNISFYFKLFDTFTYAKKNKISIEMAARKLRYNWFEGLRQKIKADYILTAHHLNDNVETALLNICRGTGLRGITGIKPKNDYIIRPLLFARKTDIENFAKINNIPFRNDLSNSNVDFSRNRIRNNIIPELEKINPDFLNTMNQNISIWNDWFKLAQKSLSELNKRAIETVENGFMINFIHLPDSLFKKMVTVEFFINQGYNGVQAANLALIINSECGTKITANKHLIIRERDGIKIENINKNFFNAKLANEEQSSQRTDGINQNLCVLCEKSPCSLSLNNINISVTKAYYNPSMTFPPEKNITWIDASKVNFPLTLRQWKAGDKFIPLGMKNFKKISDFLTDIKISASEKPYQTVVTDCNGIIWVTGQRIDNRYAVDEKTDEIIVLTLSETS